MTTLDNNKMFLTIWSKDTFPNTNTCPWEHEVLVFSSIFIKVTDYIFSPVHTKDLIYEALYEPMYMTITILKTG